MAIAMAVVTRNGREIVVPEELLKDSEMFHNVCVMLQTDVPLHIIHEQIGKWLNEH